MLSEKSFENSEDKNNIRIKVVDKVGSPVKNAIFTLKDEMTASTKDYKTDSEGICILSVDELKNSDYIIELSDPQYSNFVDKTVGSNKREYKIKKFENNITFDEKDFDGEVKTIHLNTVVESEDSFKEVDNENIRLKITDNNGNTISGVKYLMKAFDENKPLNIPTSDKNGLIIIPIADLEAKPYELKIDDSIAKKYNIVEGKGRYIVSNNSTPIVIASKQYDGKVINIKLEEKGNIVPDEVTNSDEGEIKPEIPGETNPKEKGDLTNLKIKVLDKNKKPVKGAKIELIDKVVSTVVGTYISDEAGIVNIPNPKFIGTYAISLDSENNYESSIPNKNSLYYLKNLLKNIS